MSLRISKKKGWGLTKAERHLYLYAKSQGHQVWIIGLGAGFGVLPSSMRVLERAGYMCYQLTNSPFSRNFFMGDYLEEIPKRIDQFNSMLPCKK
jgi:hypothetical protein